MENAIEVKDLFKNYKTKEAVKGITFKVEKGSFFAFLGVNGAGKSTTINILSTVIEKTSGLVKVCGYDLDKEKEKIRNLVGIVFQESVLDKKLTVKENLLCRASYYGLSRKESIKRIEYVKEILSLEELLSRRFETLSGGERRRVDIARALLNEPEILFLDEPTTGLDPQNRRKVYEVIDNLRLNKKITVFLTTHYMEETAKCDSVIIIDNGKIVAKGSPHELKDKYAKNRLIWYTEEAEDKNSIIKKTGFPFEYSFDSYKIEIKENADILPFIDKNSLLIKDFELIKGDMDDVFLNVTGKALGD
ncbi:MAG: ABC transporter ATP-binding protein [Bacillales bacterium]|nr:ABC transporter ATP-binding protein [Bacillales bacterium]